MEKDEKELLKKLSFEHASSLALRGKQSVRATFKLSRECIEAISIVATHLGIKQKSLFDHLVEDTETLLSIASEFQDRRLKTQKRIQKTFVMSRQSLHLLDTVSKNYNAPRDALVEYSVHRLLPIITREKEVHNRRKAIFDEITKHFETGHQLLQKIHQTLGEDDVMFDRYESIMTFYANNYEYIESFMDKSKIIEDFDPNEMARIFQLFLQQLK